MCAGWLAKQIQNIYVQLFVMLRVLHRPQTDPLVWQKALLAAEADDVLGGAATSAGEEGEVRASQGVVDRFRRLAGGGAQGAAPPARRPFAGEEVRPWPPAARAAAVCSSRSQLNAGSWRVLMPPRLQCAICVEPMAEGGEAVTFCASCGQNVHGGCIAKWISTRRAQGIQISCPYCRGNWVDGLHPEAGASGAGGGQYINLAAASEAHRGADVSLEALYGDRAVWLRAGQGQISRAAAAATWRALQGQ